MTGGTGAVWTPQTRDLAILNRFAMVAEAVELEGLILAYRRDGGMEKEQNMDVWDELPDEIIPRWCQRD